MTQKCVHKGCGKVFTDPEEPCVYHPGPPEFHEGQKGWKCCKPRVLTFDEFLSIPPCTTGKHSAVDDTPAPEPKKAPPPDSIPAPQPTLASTDTAQPATERRALGTQAGAPPASPAPPPEEESDDPSASITPSAPCRRKGCKATYDATIPRDEEQCVYHPGVAIFHEGSKGWSCCKRRVLEFDQFMKIEGCKTKKRHLFLEKKKGQSEEKLDTVRNDFYQTANTVIASFYLKKIIADKAKVDFSSPTTIDLDLPTSDNKRYATTLPLFGPIDTGASQFKIMGTKLELTLVKSDGASWPVLRSDDKPTGERIQIGRAARA